MWRGEVVWARGAAWIRGRSRKGKERKDEGRRRKFRAAFATEHGRVEFQERETSGAARGKTRRSRLSASVRAVAISVYGLPDGDESRTRKRMGRRGGGAGAGRGDTLGRRAARAGWTGGEGEAEDDELLRRGILWPIVGPRPRGDAAGAAGCAASKAGG